MKVKRLHPDAKLPTKAYQGDAGLDLYAIEDKVIPVWNGEEVIDFMSLPAESMTEVKTGVAVAIPENHFGRVACRSSLGKKGIRLHLGTIDCGYRNEISILMQNLGKKPYEVKRGDKIAQLIIIPFKEVEIEEVVDSEELPISERGMKGHGSSGK